MYAQAVFLNIVLSCLAYALEQQAVIVPGAQHIIQNPGAEHQYTSASSALRQFHHGGCSANAGFVAFGDSYSAGIGTGVEGEENDCRQGIHAYPKLIAADCKPMAFQFLSCTGAGTTNVMVGGDESQMDLFKYAFWSRSSPSLVTPLLLLHSRTSLIIIQIFAIAKSGDF